MKEVILLGAILHLATCQVAEILQSFEYLYEQVRQNLGDDYMEGIEFNRQYYNYEALDGEEFDFIVVGAGPSGSVLAHRLTENRGFKVLLLEAGDVAPITTDIPYLLPLNILDDRLGWSYKYEKNKHFGWGIVDGTMVCPRGKGLGGSTLLNYMIFTGGTQQDFDEIAKLGNDEWSWEKIQPIFKGIENVRIDVEDFDKRGHMGPLYCDTYSGITEVGKAFLEATVKNGLPHIDYNLPYTEGTGFIQNTIKNGLRLSAEKAYLRPIKKRPNVKILTRSLVEKVIIDENNIATGVIYSRDGRAYTANAKKEVILSAGTFNSPQLLMLSGIGPKAELEKHGITCIKDLPVGRNYKDHFIFMGLIFEADQPITLKPVSNFDMQSLATNGDGPLAHAYIETLAFLQTLSSDKEYLNGRPNIEIVMFPADVSQDGGTMFRRLLGISQELYNSYYKPNEGKNTFMATPVLLQPKSTGSVTLRSRKIKDAPVIRFPFLKEKEDITAFIEGINRTIDICNEEPMAKYRVKPVSTVCPLCAKYRFHSNKYWECALRTVSGTAYHPVGTCRMGPDTDPNAVVDQQGRVHGIKNLRVVDASIFPFPTSTHTQVPTYVVGEKIALDLKKEYMIENILYVTSQEPISG